MSKRVSHQIRIAGPARRDIAGIIRWSREQFGEDAALRYEELIIQAILDLQEDPKRPGSKERSEVMKKGSRTYHLRFSQHHVSGNRVKEPRHFLLYRTRIDGVIEVSRVLHDTRDLARHLPEEYQLD